jgi:hypothetical protein
VLMRQMFLPALSWPIVSAVETNLKASLPVVHGNSLPAQQCYRPTLQGAQAEKSES